MLLHSGRAVNWRHAQPLAPFGEGVVDLGWGEFGFPLDSFTLTLTLTPWSEFPIVPSYPHYPQGGAVAQRGRCFTKCGALYIADGYNQLYTPSAWAGRDAQPLAPFGERIVHLWCRGLARELLYKVRSFVYSLV